MNIVDGRGVAASTKHVKRDMGRVGLEASPRWFHVTLDTYTTSSLSLTANALNVFTFRGCQLNAKT